MKALEYFTAKKIKKQTGKEHEKEVSTWKERQTKMATEMQEGSFKPITLDVDYMHPEGLIFYNLRGNKMLSDDTMFFIDTMVVDNGDNKNQHIMPTFFLIKNKGSKGPASIDNTTMYRVTYNKPKNGSEYSYTIDTLIKNEDEATSKLFPELFCSMQVTPSSLHFGNYSQHGQIYYSPLSRHKDSHKYTRSINFAQIEDTYENRILNKLKEFGRHPSHNFDAEREL